MISNTAELEKELFRLQDKRFKDFHSKLIPNIKKDTIIGIKTPILRMLVKKQIDFTWADIFFRELPHKYYEENNIHGLLIEKITDFSRAAAETERFLPYVDNWATCDMFFPKTFKTHLSELFEHIKQWLKSSDTYTVRFGIKALMTCFLDNEFGHEHLKMVQEASDNSSEYYIQMGAAWYYATALAKQPDAVLPLLEGKQLCRNIHNKTIQKAVESYRISEEMKTHLRTLRIKNS